MHLFVKADKTVGIWCEKEEIMDFKNREKTMEKTEDWKSRRYI